MRFFLGGLRHGVSPQNHGGMKKHEGFAAEKRVKEVAQSLFLWGAATNARMRELLVYN